METTSIRHMSHRPTLVHDHLVTLRSRKLTALLVARVDSPAPRGALSWSEPTSSPSAPMERTSLSARSAGALLPRAQLTEPSSLARTSGAEPEVTDSVVPRDLLQPVV